MSETIPPEERPGGGYERRDLEPRHIALFALFSVGILLFAAALAFWIVQSASRRHAALHPSPRPALPREARPEPPLLVQGSKELREMRKSEEAALNSYSWIDRQKGLARIPVERAMEILAEREGKSKK